MVPLIPRKNESISPVRLDRARPGFGPQLAFAAATLSGFVVFLGSRALLSADAVVPVVSTLFLLLAAAFGVVAWRGGRMDPSNVTYADVAGALTLIGLCAAATIDPEQMVRLAERGRE
jgi:hypothetical protein